MDDFVEQLKRGARLEHERRRMLSVMIGAHYLYEHMRELHPDMPEAVAPENADSIIDTTNEMIAKMDAVVQSEKNAMTFIPTDWERWNNYQQMEVALHQIQQLSSNNALVRSDFANSEAWAQYNLTINRIGSFATYWQNIIIETGEIMLSGDAKQINKRSGEQK